MTIRGRILVLLAALAVGAGAVFGLHAYRYKDEFVFLSVEESSSSALAAFPVGWERLPGTFVDCDAKSIELEKDPRLFGVSLGVHFVSSSQGVEFAESMCFSRTGRALIRVAEPISVEGRDWSGNPVEMIDNAARVVRGDLVVEKTEDTGVVHLRYGDERFTLAPDQTWAELLTVSAGAVREIAAESWETELDACLSDGAPVTRLAIVNRGFWPKANVSAFRYDMSGGVER